MLSSQHKLVKLGLHAARINGIADDDPYFVNHVQDYIEPEFEMIISGLIPADAVCIDIGANIGIKTFILAKQAKDGVVLSIEASPRVYEALRQNIDNNKLENVLAVNAAVTDTTTTVRFAENSAWGHIQKLDCGEGCGGTEVAGITLKDMLDKHLPHKTIHFVKIDVEGHEYVILENAAPVFQQHNPWIYFEYNSLCLLCGDTNPKEFLKWIFSNFEYVFRVEKNALNAGNALLRRVNSSDWQFLLYENIVSNGSVDDFIVTNRKSALHEVRTLLLPSPVMAQLQAQRELNREIQAQLQACHMQNLLFQQNIQEVQAALNGIRLSRSFRLTAPLRALANLLRKFSQ